MNPHSRRPPLLGRVLLRGARLGDRRAECESDLQDLFDERVASEGLTAARRRYVKDALSVCLHPPATPQNARRPEPARPSPLESVRSDIRFAIRVFRRQAGIMTLAVAGLALAIGANTAAFSVINAAAFRSLGVPFPDRAVAVYPLVSSSSVRKLTYREFVQCRDQARQFRPEAFLAARASLGEAADVDASNGTSVPARIVSGRFFATFGGRAALGRVFGDADDLPAAPIALLSADFWRSHFGEDPTIVGRSMRIEGTTVQIVGVLAPSFTGPFLDVPAIWFPLGSAHALFDYLDPLQTEPTSAAANGNTVDVVAQLAPGVTLAAASAEASSLLPAISSATPFRSPVVSALVRPAQPSLSPQELAVLTSFMLIVGLVLVLACTNVANLLLASAAARRQEIGARLALGASRGRIVRQLLTESLLLSVIGGLFGLLASVWALPVLMSALPIPRSLDVSPDWRVFLFASCLTLLTGVMAGLAPARHGMRGDLVSPVKGASVYAGMRDGRWRRATVGVQAAASIILLVLAALFGRAVLYASTMDLGFDPEKFLTAQPRVSLADRSGVQAAAWLESAVARVRLLPDVAGSALTLLPPVGSPIMPVILEHDGHPFDALEHRTSADYFSVLGVTLARGRLFTADEVREQAAVAVISQSLASAVWGAADPIGLPLSNADRGANEAAHAPSGVPDLARYRVIGIVNDVVSGRLTLPGARALYLPMLRDDLHGAARLLVRTRGDARESLGRISQALAAVDPGVRTYWYATADDYAHELGPARMAATLTSILGAFAIALAVLGLFGVTSVVVAQRTTEVGIRMALGATGARIVGQFVRESLRPVVVGLGVGLVVALIGSRFLASVLYGISPHDPIAVVSAVALLIVSAVLAAVVPARRAAHLDPASVLRATQ